MTFYPRKKYVRPVVCPCGQPIGPTRAAQKHRRCLACVERFARSRELPPPWWQRSLFGGDARPSRDSGNGAGASSGKAATAARPSGSVSPKPAAPQTSAPATPPAARPDAVALTAARAAELRAAADRAAADRRMQRYTALRAQGVSRERAMAIVDAEEGTEP